MDGKPKVFRTASGVNTMWTQLLIDKDPSCEVVLARMKELSGIFPLAASRGDMKACVRAMDEFVELRVGMGARFMELVVAGMQTLATTLSIGAVAFHKQWTAAESEDIRELAQNDVAAHCAAMVWDPTMPEFQDLSAVRAACAEKHTAGKLEEVTSTDFYVFGPAKALLRDARSRGDIAVMPLGAGGPGANLMVLTSNPLARTYIESFLASHGIHKMKHAEVETIVASSGIMQGWMPVEIGMDPWSYTIESTQNEKSSGIAIEANTKAINEAIVAMHKLRSSPPCPATYNNMTGEIIVMKRE
eukprot:SAG31_NODE_79_length_27235_cov_6.268868_4_plen_302_part_00